MKLLLELLIECYISQTVWTAERPFWAQWYCQEQQQINRKEVARKGRSDLRARIEKSGIDGKRKMLKPFQRALIDRAAVREGGWFSLREYWIVSRGNGSKKMPKARILHTHTVKRKKVKWKRDEEGENNMSKVAWKKSDFFFLFLTCAMLNRALRHSSRIAMACYVRIT